MRCRALPCGAVLCRAVPCCALLGALLYLLFRTCHLSFEEPYQVPVLLEPYQVPVLLEPYQVPVLLHQPGLDVLIVPGTLLNHKINALSALSPATIAQQRSAVRCRAVSCRALRCGAVPCCAVLSFEHAAVPGSRHHAKFQV